MDFNVVLIVAWFVLAVVFVVLEMMSNKYFLPVALGAGLAGVAGLLSLVALGQLVVFAVVTALGYLLFRPDKKASKRRAMRERGYDDDDYLEG